MPADPDPFERLPTLLALAFFVSAAGAVAPANDSFPTAQPIASAVWASAAMGAA